MIVVDCSAIVDALAGAPGADGLRAHLAEHELHAPSLLDYEVVSVTRRLALAGRLSGARGRQVLADFDDLPIRRWPFAAALRDRAFELRDNASAYDAAYIALAEALACPLLTRDGRLARSTGHDAAVEVR